MQTVTFACPHCNNLMAATTDLLGQQVHCPTSQNVAIAPAPISDSDPGLTFDAPPREAADSIFGEIPDEDVMGGGSERTLVLMPEDLSPLAPAASGTGFASYPPPETTTSPSLPPLFELDIPVPTP